MDQISAVAGSTSPDNAPTGDWKRKRTFLSRCTEIYESKYWYPPALRAPVLVFTIATCWGLIAVLEYLLWKSQRDSGLIFAPVINDLPLSKTFLYMYFPTIVAVIFSIYWAWIDLETKRMEPYYQLSKENGALGKDSLLLQYPFSFIPLAPLRAFRDRHWPVFWASFAVVLVTWGLVPTQAGIFSVKTVTRTSNITVAVSTASMPFENQATGLTLRYAQSTYGIVALNETLPPYMGHNFTLAPFRPQHEGIKTSGQSTFTAPTTMYTLDLVCEDVSHKADGTAHMVYSSKDGCNSTLGLTGNLTRGELVDPRTKTTAIKEYTGQYIGYHNGGWADYYLSSDCPRNQNSTFFAALAKSKGRAQDPPQDVTAIFCHARYWRQEVSATVDMSTKAPTDIKPLADKQALEWNVFNTTNFESAMNSVTLGIEVRGDNLPGYYMPRYWDLVSGTNLSLTSGAGAITMPMVGLAVAAGPLPMEDYLDWERLSKAYADAYGLLFARAMVDVLGNNFTDSEEVSGKQQITTEAVVLEPVFVHIVVGFLAVVSLATAALLVLSLTRRRNLRTDPSTIASIMAMVADNHPLLSDFADLDCCTMEDVQISLGEKRYKLINDDLGMNLVELAHGQVTTVEGQALDTLGTRRDSPTSIAKPVRPIEFSFWVAVPFVNLFVVLAIFLGVVYGKAHADGLPLPSSNTIVQNILENYIPTAIATLIEPMWILINRLLCMLQPLEELQDCNAKADKSIDANYNSLPPQLVVFQALKSKHFVLAAVCAMALLANVLAIAFSGLFNQQLINVRYTTSLRPPYQLKFVPIDGYVGPSEGSGSSFPPWNASGAYRGGDGQDQFLIAESNLTRGTSMPAWTDDTLFYVPMFAEVASKGQPNKTILEGQTQGFGATLDCNLLKIGKDFQAGISDMASLNISITSGSSKVHCHRTSLTFGKGPLSQVTNCVTGPSSLEFVTNLSPRENATKRETDVCMGSVVLGWMRGAEGLCSDSSNITMSDKNTLFVQCKPRLIAGSATISVDASGRLQRPAEDITLHDSFNSQNLFSTDPINLIGQSNRYLFRYGSTLHNDSYATDMMNHFARRISNSSRLIDPNLPLPTFQEAVGDITKAYSKLFAIWLGNYKQTLLLPVANDTSESIEGASLKPEQRLFLSTAMFLISEAILCTYVVVAIWVYARRPGQYLARLPTSIAAVIALFAASTAVLDMQGTAHLDGKNRAQHLKGLNSRYGFGSFIGGGDGRVHIGIEKAPLVVKPRAKSTWLEQKLPLLRRGSAGSV